MINLAQPTVINLTQPGQVNLVQAVPASNYRSLRDTDNVYWINSYQYVIWSSSQIKINNSTRNTLIGTDGNDVFDATYYWNYASWFPTVLTNFMDGGGDDEVGRSTGNDSIWGGLGNNTLYGYAENDSLDGGAGDDRLFGNVGNDVLTGRFLCIRENRAFWLRAA